MPHAIRIDGSSRTLRGEWSRAGSVRVCRTASGDAFVVTRGGSDATCDGLPMLGDCAVVRWGGSALIRVDGLKVEILWRALGERRPAQRGERCRVCFGDFKAETTAGPGTETPGEAIVCSCTAVFHPWCDAVRVNCSTCGRPRAEEIA